jgi:hypothetical protein
MNDTNRTKSSVGSRGERRKKTSKPFVPKQEWNNSVALREKKLVEKIVGG